MTAAGLPVEPVVLAPRDAMPDFVTRPLTRSDFVRYAGAGGDFNPIHHDETFATAAGLPSVFGMGLLHAGVAGLRLARWVGPTNVERFACRFTGQVWPGDVLTIAGVVEDVDAGRATVTLTVRRQTGEVCLTAQATVRSAR